MLSATPQASQNWCETAGTVPPGYLHALDHQTKSSLGNPSLKTNGEGKTVRNALSDNAGLKPGEDCKNKQVGTTHSVVVFLTGYFRDKSAKQIARVAGIGIRSAEGIKQGRQTFSMASLERAQRADPDFAAAWAAHVGLLLPGEAEYAGATTRAHNAWLRMKAAREADADNFIRAAQRLGGAE